MPPLMITASSPHADDTPFLLMIFAMPFSLRHAAASHMARRRFFMLMPPFRYAFAISPAAFRALYFL